jgi:hypothetical protein
MISFCQAGEVGTYYSGRKCGPSFGRQVEVALYRTSLGGLEGKEIATVGAGPRKKEARTNRAYMLPRTPHFIAFGLNCLEAGGRECLLVFCLRGREAHDVSLPRGSKRLRLGRLPS